MPHANPAVETSESLVAPINYAARGGPRPRYHANDTSRDVLTIAPQPMVIENARAWSSTPTVDREGFALMTHRSAVTDFRDETAVAAVHPGEIRDLLLAITGADAVTVNGRGILRFGEGSKDSGRLDNSRPARFAHIDMSDDTARAFIARGRENDDRPIRRFCYFNVWRAFSPPPQDVPLALCDARSVAPDDIIIADAVFDAPGQPEWSFEGLVIAHNPAHRWAYFRDMTRDEVIVFKTHDSDPDRAHNVPHVAFDDPSCPPGVAPRASIEMRGTAFWYA